MKLAYLLLIVVGTGLGIMSPVVGRAEKGRSLTNNSDAVAPTQADRAEKAAYDRAMETLVPASDALDNHQPVDFPMLRTAMEKYWAEYPNGWRSPLNFYMDMFARVHPERVEAEWASFTNCASPVAARLAQAKVRFVELSHQPFDFAVVALDGRAVDLRKLRGKVVLIDFWATWCVPCVQQIPELKRLYAQYHQQGLEIIGVSLDRPEDKQKLVDFVSQKGLAWPQYFDGKVWQNEIAARYAISSAPTTFLLDQEGRLVGIDLKGNLENEVKQLLGLHPIAPK
jgi:thiol-disulfide isomerase/thioredoxin